jgi:aminopeptidase N
VTPSETAGHIGLEGVYLSGETLWYPDQEGSLPTYRLTVTVPQGWETVSHGRQIRHESTVRDGAASVTAGWEVPDKTEALTLVANRFVKDQRDWQGIELATYLFPEDARLSEEYLEATARYLALYTSLLGPYPFPKFAVVENFFASGLGMPSFTLLGSGVIKRHYVQPYALGHEIVHSWFGNSVFNDSSRGNWVEGLTTYLANYYYEELKGTPEQARDQRRLMLLGYAVHVRPDDDYPVGRFTHKSDQTDNAIGYQKAAMIFHMLRREVGEAAFWQGIKRLVAERTGTYATWQDLSAVFSRAAGRDLGWFFTQWVDRAGAPMLRIAESHVTREAGPSFAVEFTVAQTEPLFRLKLPLSVLLADGREQNLDVEMQAARQSYRLSVPGQPVRLRLDPESAIFRRLSRSRIPAMLNLFVTDSRKIVVTPEDASNEDRQPYKELADRVIAQSQQARAVRSSDADGNLQDASVLVLGPPHVNQAAAWAVRGCGDQVRLGRGEFTIADRTFREPDQALLVSCRHPDNPQHVVTLFYGHSPAAAAKVGRLLFFYGWQSYLVFQDGKIIARGDFPAPDPDTDVAVTSDK